MFSLSTSSVRNVEIKVLSQQIATLKGGAYVLVSGGKGFGKSCLIQTALHRKLGVIYTTAS
jgi:predicted AAA+ superfamily ATPase